MQANKSTEQNTFRRCLLSEDDVYFDGDKDTDRENNCEIVNFVNLCICPGHCATVDY